MEERLTEVELRYMEQERTIQELNDIVCRHDVVIELLRQEIIQLKQQLMAVAPSVTRDPAEEEPPPHY